MTTTLFDVIIGMMYVYLFFSVLSSGINEWVARYRKIRATMLRNYMPSLLGSCASGQLAAKLYQHPLIRGIQMNPPYPTYIPPTHFALVLMDLAIETKPGSEGTIVLVPRDKIFGTDVALTAPEKQLIDTLIAKDNSPRSVQERIEHWFEDSMERLSGLYKRKTYLSLLLISLVVCFGFGIDTFYLADQLYLNPALRQGLVAASQNAVQSGHIVSPHLPLGWNSNWCSFIPGCLLSAFALTLGAPFWFDLLGRLVNLRQTGVPPDLKNKIVAQ